MHLAQSSLRKSPTILPHKTYLLALTIQFFPFKSNYDKGHLPVWAALKINCIYVLHVGNKIIMPCPYSSSSILFFTPDSSVQVHGKQV